MAIKFMFKTFWVFAIFSVVLLNFVVFSLDCLLEIFTPAFEFFLKAAWIAKASNFLFLAILFELCEHSVNITTMIRIVVLVLPFRYKIINKYTNIFMFTSALWFIFNVVEISKCLVLAWKINIFIFTSYMIVNENRKSPIQENQHKQKNPHRFFNIRFFKKFELTWFRNSPNRNPNFVDYASYRSTPPNSSSISLNTRMMRGREWIRNPNFVNISFVDERERMKSKLPEGKNENWI